MDYGIKLNKWLTDPYFDEDIKYELRMITDEAELKNRFETDLDFGTGGLRGIMGAGTNRMNIYTVRRATYGLALYLLEQHGAEAKNKGTVIAYDSRNMSDEFARQTALIFCACGIRAYLFKFISATPELSFAVRYLGCVAGVVITASHNPKEYNGYKAYDEYGCQFVPEQANKIIEKVNSITEFETIPIVDEKVASNSGLLTYIGNDVREHFYQAVYSHQLLNNDAVKQNLAVVYTPLHGTGNIPVREILRRDGFSYVKTVEEQEMPDPTFPTIISPNPEDKAALDLGIQYAKKMVADIVIGTDPDCDRVGIAIRNDEDFILLTGNQVGALLTYYILNQKKKLNQLKENSVIIKTIVTSDLGAEIAKKFKVKTIETLTGFKYIGELITQFEKDQSYDFVMGYEESYGYLIGKHARDKDAVVTSMLICEMAAYYKAQGKTLIDVMTDIYAEFGYYADHLDNLALESDGTQKVIKLMNYFREKAQKALPFESVLKDYALGVDGLPRSDVLKFVLADGSWIAVRPSGTEPKIKFYYSIRSTDKTVAQNRLEEIRNAVQRVIESI